MGKRFCARCGRPDDGSIPFIGSLCLNCFLEINKLLCVPSRLFFQYCRFCGSIRVGYRWEPGGELDEAVPIYARLVLEKVKPCVDVVARYRLVELTPVTEISWRTVFTATYEVELNGSETVVRQSYRVEVRAIPSICPSCHMARGGDYNVLVQIRGKLTRPLARLLANKLDELGGKVVDVVERGNGVDVFLEDRSAASRLLRELRKHARLRVKYSSEDVGVMSTGKLRRRLVISVRIG